MILLRSIFISLLIVKVKSKGRLVVLIEDEVTGVDGILGQILELTDDVVNLRMEKASLNADFNLNDVRVIWVKLVEK